MSRALGSFMKGTASERTAARLEELLTDAGAWENHKQLSEQRVPQSLYDAITELLDDTTAPPPRKEKRPWAHGSSIA